jgi:photosystem II stability/assembly factor-like uncharacterized protein
MTRHVAVLAAFAAALAGPPQANGPSPFRNMHWEPLGPSMQGGRIEAIAAAAPGSGTLYVGPGAGNVWKTTDNGMTWQPVFDHESAFAIGDIAVAPSNSDIVWVGTGEAQPRHSGPSYAGTGIFKSTDAGRTWRNMGLAETQHIPKILIDPKNPNIVYAAAMGSYWKAGAERGVFRTTDGGHTWRKVLFVSDHTGVVDMAMDPSDPKTIYACAWQLTYGNESAIYRTTDGGETWKKLTQGLPAGMIGRSGIDVAAANPRVVYAFIDNGNSDGGNRTRNIKGGEVYRSDDRGDTWYRANKEDIYPVFGVYGWKFCDVRVSPDNANEIYILGLRAFHSTDGGKTYERVGETIRRIHDTEGAALHLDQHELWIDPANPNRLLLGNDGGLFESCDRGRTWLHLNNIPIGQFYFVAVDMRDPYMIYGGTQDNGALLVSSTYRPDDEPAGNDGWRHVWIDEWTGGDAFVTLPDPIDPRFVYYEHQNGDIRRIDITKGIPFSGGPASESIRPQAPHGEASWRFGWFAPFFISRHNPRALYAGGNVILKSTNRGAEWQAISPDLSKPAGGDRALVPYGTVTSLSESRFAPGILYAGTEAGDVYYTRNDGRDWKKVSAGLPAKWVSRVLASDHKPGVVYLTMTGVREDDFASYVFRSEDFGGKWTAIAHNLPAGPVNVIREDPRRPNVLYVGADGGVYVSIDGGDSWQSLAADMPRTAVMDLVIHPREDELIAATHGRSMFLLDVRPIQALSAEVRSSALHLFDVRPVKLRWWAPREVPPRPPRGRAWVHYWLATAQQVAIVIRDSHGRGVRTLRVQGGAGVNTAMWDTRNDEGVNVPPGVYTIDVMAGTARVSTTVALSPVD